MTGVQTCALPICFPVTIWLAAPLNEDGGVDCAPSKHEERRRVRLISIVDRDSNIASILHFNDTDEDVIDENGDATGSLADLLAEIFN